MHQHVLLFDRVNQFELLNRITTTYLWVSPLTLDLLKRYDLVQRRSDVPNNRFKDMLMYPVGYRLPNWIVG